MSPSEWNYSSRTSGTSSRLHSSHTIAKSKGVFEEASSKRRRRQSESGQIVLEYVLLLVFAVTIAAVVTKAMISHDSDEPGFVIKAWDRMLKDIGQDTADDIKRE